MSILEICESNAASVSVEATAEQAIQLLLDRHLGGIAVVDHEGRVAGVFTERDVLRRLALSGRSPS
ncbi:CBS domain-containing protein, partial [Salmonella sp. NW378]|uniref:CBS domain-containing protein n=1 Tax=Salmonella sp. NW378 TaxID=2947938 RepID=UPI003F43DC84